MCIFICIYIYDISNPYLLIYFGDVVVFVFTSVLPGIFRGPGHRLWRLRTPHLAHATGEVGEVGPGEPADAWAESFRRFVGWAFPFGNQFAIFKFGTSAISMCHFQL